MIVRRIKLKLTSEQEANLDLWLWRLTGVYNWAIRKIELDAKDHIFYSEIRFRNLLAGHSRKLEIPSKVLQGMLCQAHDAWTRCFKRLAKKPHLKGNRNKLNSIPFPSPLRFPKNQRISLLGLGKVRFFKQDIPEAKIKCARLIRRPSGWYLCLFLDTVHVFPVKETQVAIGIDPGFKTLLTLSDGTTFENPRELRIGAKRLAQAQRGHRHQLVARLFERQQERRRDRNHKISRKIIENYRTICLSKDSFRSMSPRFGKSVSEAALGGLTAMITVKGRTGGRSIIAVDSRYSTMTCSTCGARSGPTGSSNLGVRQWECVACGSQHDRDLNAARVILAAGLGSSPGRQECQITT